MNCIHRLLPALLLAYCGTAFSAPPPERTMAVEAFLSGDYRNAAQLYARSRELAQREGDDNAWMEDTLGLARAKLRSGDAAAARELLTQFTKRFPAHSPGLLPGEILAAEGKIPEAESFFRTIQNSGADASQRHAADLALAYLQLRFGSAALALEELTRLEENAAMRRDVRPLRIYALIRNGRPQEARQLASDSARGFAPPLPESRLKLLSLLADLRSGSDTGFDAAWEKLRTEIQPCPDALVFEVLDSAARSALTGKHPEKAALYWRDAYGFSDGDDERRDVLRKLFNYYSGADVKRAAETAERYAEYFPEASDRAQLLTGAGRLLAGAGNPRAALTFFERVISDNDILLPERCDAARDAALAAEAAGDHEAAAKYFTYLIGKADSTASQHRALLFYAEYLLRRRDYSAAEKALRQVTGSAVRELADKAEYLLIQALLPLKRFAPALTAADRLKKSADPKYAEFGEFHAALLTENLGRSEEARRLYLDFSRRYKTSAYVREARFAAALLALKSGKYPEAAREFRRYAADYPDDASAAAALFWAVRGCCLAGDASGAESAFNALKSGPGPGAEYYAAALQLAEHLRSSGGAARGLTLMDELDKSRCADAEAAALSLERARLLSGCRRNSEAIREAEELLARHPSSAVAADAAFLAGNLRADRGEYVEALADFRRARELRPSGLFGEVAEGRIADTLLSLYGATQRTEDLNAAAESFGRLAEGARFPAVRLQSLFKLGCCREYLGERLKALDAYYQALLFAGVLKKNNIPFEAAWCSRSAYAALRLLLDSGVPGRLQRGSRIIEAYRKLELPGSDAEFEALRKEFTELYLNREI